MAWTNWKNVGGNFSDASYTYKYALTGVYGNEAGAIKTTTTQTYTVENDGELTLIGTAVAKAQVGTMTLYSFEIYHNGISVLSGIETPVTIDVSVGDTIYAVGKFKVGSESTVVAQGHTVLTIIQGD